MEYPPAWVNNDTSISYRFITPKVTWETKKNIVNLIDLIDPGFPQYKLLEVFYSLNQSSYAVLMLKFWSNFWICFIPYSQQDAQEFLRFLLEGLHEDVNAVKKKPRYNTEISEDLRYIFKVELVYGKYSWNLALRELGLLIEYIIYCCLGKPL